MKIVFCWYRERIKTVINTTLLTEGSLVSILFVIYGQQIDRRIKRQLERLIDLRRVIIVQVKVSIDKTR